MIVYVDIMEKLAARGFSSYRLRQEKLLPESTLTRIRNGTPVSTDTIDRLCELLECQPGDILRWEPGE